MEKKKKLILPPFVFLCLIAIVMSAAISWVYMQTKDIIAASALEAQAAARREVMAEAFTMTELPVEEGAAVDYCYEAFDANGQSIGYISQITVMGFGGEIEVTIGMDRTGAITAVRVGGANFAETSGLGAKTRDAAFTDQFAGKSGMLVLKQDIDSVTGASVSSSAVVGGVNRALTYMSGLLPAAPVSDVEEIGLSAEELMTLTGGGEVTWMGGGDGIDGWWQTADGGYIVRATGFGLGPIVVTVALDADGMVQAILIGDDSFMESAGYGARVQEEAYWGQFIGRSGEQAYGDDLDGISGASTTANATLEAINACMTFDPDNPGTVAAEPASQEPASTEPAAPAEPAVTVSAEPASQEPAPTPDAATAASTVVLATPAPTPVPTPDAATTASTVVLVTPEPTPDAATAASTVVLATPAPTPVPTPDAATTASTVVLVTPEPTPLPDAATAASTVLVG